MENPPPRSHKYELDRYKEHREENKMGLVPPPPPCTATSLKQCGATLKAGDLSHTHKTPQEVFLNEELADSTLEAIFYEKPLLIF